MQPSAPPVRADLGVPRRVLSAAVIGTVLEAMVADHFGLDGRGRLAEGAWADVAVLDTATLARQETFRLPAGYAAGVPYVIVNGALVVDRGEHRGVRAGRFLPRST
jgi:N-acyl-D-aspartate/D-glutamate deacylase